MGSTFSRGGGSYLSPWKIFAAWLLFLAWVRTTDWISQDGQIFKLKYGIWNPIAFFSFFLALLAAVDSAVVWRGHVADGHRLRGAARRPTSSIAISRCESHDKVLTQEASAPDDRPRA